MNFSTKALYVLGIVMGTTFLSVPSSFASNSGPDANCMEGKDVTQSTCEDCGCTWSTDACECSMGGSATVEVDGSSESDWSGVPQESNGAQSDGQHTSGTRGGGSGDNDDAAETETSSDNTEEQIYSDCLQDVYDNNESTIGYRGTMDDSQAESCEEYANCVGNQESYGTPNLQVRLSCAESSLCESQYQSYLSAYQSNRADMGASNWGYWLGVKGGARYNYEQAKDSFCSCLSIYELNKITPICN